MAGKTAAVSGYCSFAVTILSIFLIILSIGMGAASAGQQAERAVAAVRSLIASGKVPAGSTINLVVKQGNINNLWGKDFALKNEWERSTGVFLNASVMPQRPVLEFLRSRSDIDITLARQHEYPDLYTEGLIIDLSAFVKKYDLAISDNPNEGFFCPKAQTTFDDKVVAIPADGDIAMLYLRKDLLEDPINKKKFFTIYHRELRPPVTWEEYLQLVEFFHDGEHGFYGTVEQRDPQTGYMFWMPRYASQAAPNQYLFDDEMRPLVDSPAGVKATQSYVDTVKYSPPGILDKDNHYNFAVPIYRRGDAFAYINTMAIAKMLNLSSSPVKEKFTCALMPGTSTNGKLVRRTSFIYGNNIVIPRNSKHPELAFLYAMWLSDPDNSARSVEVTTGIADPYRYNHVRLDSIQSIYTKQATDSLLEHVEIAVPEGTGLPGDNEYLAVLNKYIWAAAKKEISPEKAMKNVSEEWEGITEKYGRRKQIAHWKRFRDKFPTTISPAAAGGQ